MSLSSLGSAADLNGDGRVDLRDYGVLAGGWLSLDTPRTEDLTRDTTVDFVDLTALASWWLWPAHQ